MGLRRIEYDNKHRIILNDASNDNDDENGYDEDDVGRRRLCMTLYRVVRVYITVYKPRISRRIRRHTQALYSIVHQTVSQALSSSVFCYAKHTRIILQCSNGINSVLFIYFAACDFIAALQCTVCITLIPLAAGDNKKRVERMRLSYAWRFWWISKFQVHDEHFVCSHNKMISPFDYWPFNLYSRCRY